MAFLFLTSVIGCMTGCGKMKEAAGTRDAGKTAGADAGLNGVHVDFAKEVNEDWSAMFARCSFDMDLGEWDDYLAGRESPDGRAARGDSPATVLR